MKLKLFKRSLAKIIPGVIIAGLTSLIPINLTAQNVTPVYVDVTQCRQITVELARLACYDTLADIEIRKNGGGQSQNPSLNQFPTTQSQNTPYFSSTDQRLMEDNRVMREEIARMRNDSQFSNSQGTSGNCDSSIARVEYDNDGDEIYYDRIAGLRKIPDGWVINLECGQVWRQMENRRYNLEQGMEVRIYPTIWGKSYRLTVEKLGGYIQVERVR